MACKLLNDALSTAVTIWGSSVTTVYDYILDDRATGVRNPAEANYFSSSLCVQTSSEAHPASYPMGTGESFSRG
jgi:hypothetical protein